MNSTLTMTATIVCGLLDIGSNIRVLYVCMNQRLPMTDRVVSDLDHSIA